MLKRTLIALSNLRAFREGNLCSRVHFSQGGGLSGCLPDVDLGYLLQTVAPISSGTPANQRHGKAMSDGDGELLYFSQIAAGVQFGTTDGRVSKSTVLLTPSLLPSLTPRP